MHFVFSALYLHILGNLAIQIRIHDMAHELVMPNPKNLGLLLTLPRSPNLGTIAYEPIGIANAHPLSDLDS